MAVAMAALALTITLPTSMTSQANEPQNELDIRMAEAHTVILLHGLARSERAMRPLAEFLEAQGYNVINEGYPSRSHDLEILANEHLQPQIQRAADHAAVTGGRVHFVTHSMGGILVRQYLSKHRLPSLGRVVMLAPPNQGSELADGMGGAWWFKLWNGPAGEQMRTGEAGVPASLPDASGYILGVIAGNDSYLPFFSDDLPGEDDGIVSVESTRLEGMTDHIVLPFNHTFIMREQTVMEQVHHFLINGRFRQPDNETPGQQ